ncbi:MAG: hypothetical protein EPN93_02720 [Spirochaetes bacterium]|nr:MAG: hypothetical protein EPN93_02720 [Spirochaetota bacterium]
MSDEIINILPRARWEVKFSDQGSWRTGIYRPEFAGPGAVETLEKHSCPELFICAGGRMGMVLYDGARERVVELDPNEALLVEDYHNGFAVDERGFFIVVERTSFTTEYIDRHTKRFIRKVET